MRDGVIAESNDRGAMFRIGFVEDAAFFDLQVEDFADGRLIALQNHVFRAIRAATDVGGAGAELRAGKCAWREKRL